MRKFDEKKIMKGARLILEGVGEDPDEKRLLSTPRRIASMLMEVLDGTHKNPEEFLKLLSEEKHEEMVLLKDIPLYSMWEHHLLPFFGHASIAYIPKKGRIMGLNTLSSLVELLSRRLQIQERLTKQIADYLIKALDPLGVMVVLKAEHLCMTMRGVKKAGSKMITSAVRGVFDTNIATREEAINLIMRY
jgi:GTP cyclohydrolase I